MIDYYCNFEFCLECVEFDSNVNVMCQVNVLEVYSSSLLLSLQTLLIIKAMALSNSIDSSMNKKAGCCWENKK